MGWQTPLTGEVRMSAEAAKQLLLLRPVDWYRPGETFGEYLGGGVTLDEQRAVLRFCGSTWVGSLGVSRR